MNPLYAEHYRKLGIRIAYLRRYRNMTQQQLADIIGIDQQHISRIERGKIGVPFEKLLQISSALRIQASKLLEYEDEFRI